jgi:hypothetical protein
MAAYPYDRDVLAYVARVLYGALPALYRTQDLPPDGRGELRDFLEVLAAPLAVLRQNIEELHGDLFIDTASDEAVSLLAEMIGTSLVFPDASSNRRDVRGTVGWRRRKGTPAALQDMAEDLSGQLVVTQEGWKRLMLSQDLDFKRPKRLVPDLRPAVVAEQAAGPLDALAHALDARAISARTGHYHPRQVVHWFHPTFTAPLRGATAPRLTVPGSDHRFAMHPLGVRQPLRARRAATERLQTDRVPEQHFAEDPAGWFGVEGRFAIRICGLLAGSTVPSTAVPRAATILPANLEVARGAPTLTLLDWQPRLFRDGVRIEIGVAPVDLPSATTWRPNTAAFSPRAGFDVNAGGAGPVASVGSGLPAGSAAVVVRLSPVGSAVGRLFPGATIEIAGGRPAARAAATDAELARAGFLRGAILVTLPAVSIVGERWFHVAADGSVFDAQEGGATGPLRDMPRSGGTRTLDPSALLAAASSPVWPPDAETAEPVMVATLPAAPGVGPRVMHGGVVLRRNAANLLAIPAAAQSRLVFAARLQRPGSVSYRPFQRLSWTGGDPATAVWSALDQNGLPVSPTAAAVDAEYADVAALARDNPGAVALAVRFECSEVNATLAPAEVAWTSFDGRTILIHLPQLDAVAVAGGDPWPGTEPFASPPVRVAEDGSTWDDNSTASRRASLGAVAPIREAIAMRRRRVYWRRLCAWINEDWTAIPPAIVPLTRPGRLDVDVLNGLFAVSADEPPQSWTPDGDGVTPPSVSSDYEDGGTVHMGARPAARERILDARLATPTRIVTRYGRLHRDAPAEWLNLPRYRSLADTLAAIDADWSGLTAAAAESQPERHEVVQIEDSATYEDEAPVWPRGPLDPAAAAAARLSLTIQAAERERPVILVDAAAGWQLPAGVPTYVAIEVIGVAFGGEGWTGLVLPPAGAVVLQLCTALFAENRLIFSDAEAGTDVNVFLCELAGTRLDGPGSLLATDSIFDAGDEPAIEAPLGTVTLERASVGGTVAVRVLEASEVIFKDRIEVEDRFHGCVRYSRVTSESILPRAFRTAQDTPVRAVSWNRRDAAWWRLRQDCDPAIRRGAENGSEMGAFHQARSAERMEAFQRRLIEFTPAGLTSGIVRVD